jgi:hypothetical protein
MNYQNQSRFTTAHGYQSMKNLNHSNLGEDRKIETKVIEGVARDKRDKAFLLSRYHGRKIFVYKNTKKSLSIGGKSVIMPQSYQDVASESNWG